MDCRICKDLERAFESRRSRYIEARSAAYYRVSTELAAKEYVDMERAKSDLDEHQLVCVSTVRGEPQAPLHFSHKLSALAVTYDGGSHGRFRPVDA
jgi:hypothetical protein